MTSQQLIRCIGVLIGLMLTQVCHADQELWFDLSVAGDAYAYPRFDSAPESVQPPRMALDQRFNGRVNFAWYPSRDAEFGLQYGLEQKWRVYQDDGDTRFADSISTTGANFRWRDLDSELINDGEGNLSLFQNLDRLYGLAYTPAGDIKIGRQAISFGLAKFYSPVDVILPFDIQAQERSYRPGVDALRWRVPTGAVSEVDVGWVFGEDEVLFGRGYTQISSLTLELTALTVNQNNALLGLGTQGALGTWGLWQEIAWLGNDDESGVRATLGVDQQVLDDIYVVGEYHYNGLGQDSGYQTLGSSDFYQLGMVVPWGQHYVSLQASNPINPLLQSQLGATLNISDGSVLATGSLDWSLSNNSSLNVAVNLPVGESPQFNAGQPTIPDEFGVYPARVSVNWSAVF